MGNSIAYVTTAGLAREHGLDLYDTVANARGSNDSMRLPIYPLFAAVTLFFLPAVWTRNTHYPRWMCVTYPLLMFALLVPVNNLGLEYFPANVYQIVMGGYYPLMWVVFYGSSTIALWNAKI